MPFLDVGHMTHTWIRLGLTVALLASMATTDTQTHPDSPPKPARATHLVADRSISPQPAEQSFWDALDVIGDVSVMRRYSSGEDLWEVWVCDLPRGHAAIDSQTATEVLAGELAPYFSWLSEGNYRLVLVPAGRAAPDPADEYPCQTSIEQRSSGEANGAIVITDELNIPPAFARPDTRRGPASSQITFPDNGRVVRVGAHVALPEAWNFKPQLAAHELGHALGWPHSYQGDTGGASQYDNPLDVMSGELPRDADLKGRPQGTLAVNRYAAGWIDPSHVGIQNGGTATYLLGPVGSDGLQLVVLPTQHRGTFTALDVRVSRHYDTGLEKEGVTVHTVDQTPSACHHPTAEGCFGHQRRTQPVLGDHETSREYPHVLGPGETLLVEHHQIQVLERLGDRFRVQITDIPQPN